MIVSPHGGPDVEFLGSPVLITHVISVIQTHELNLEHESREGARIHGECEGRIVDVLLRKTQ